MIALLAAILLKGTILVTAAAAVVAVMFRASAATRHFIWTLTIVGLLLLPVFSTTLPRWALAVPLPPIETSAAIDVARHAGATSTTPVTASASATLRETAIESPTTAARRSWPLVVVAVYVLGVLILLGRFVIHRSVARRIVRRTTAVSDREWTSLLDDCAARIGVGRSVSLRRSLTQVMPVTAGTIAPSIVIPADADGWNEDRRRAVLLHELAHIARQDCLTQMLAALACAVYWFHPGVWYVARRLRIEREVACDDRVLGAGAHAPEYAGHLLELAYSWSGRRAPALVIGMGSSRKLEGRMRAVLDPGRNRTAPGRRMWLMGAALSAALLLPLAAMTMTTASADMRSRLMASSGEQDILSQRDARSNAAEPPIGSPDNVAGTWELRPSRNRGSVRIAITAGAFSSDGEIPWSEIEGLASQSLAEASGPIRFTISRDAGALEIAGTITSGSGSGTFRFVPSERFIAGLTSRGFTRPTARQIFILAQNDIGFDIVDELAAQKYERPDIDGLVRAAHHGVRTDFVREMAQLGYRLATLDTLIRFRDHGVDPEYVRGMRAHGVSGIPPDDLIRARDHGVDPEYIGDLTSLGYNSQPFDMLIRARDHGVDPTYVEFMALEGYKGLPIETLIRLRDHGVTADYVRDIRKSGRDKLSPDEIIRLRDNGIAGRSDRLNYHWARLLDKLARELDQAIQKLKRKVA